MGDQYEPINLAGNPPPPPPNQYEVPAFGKSPAAAPPPPPPADDPKSKSDFKSAVSNVKDASRDEGEGGKTEDNDNDNKSKKSRVERASERKSAITADEQEPSMVKTSGADPLSMARIKFCKKAKIGVITGSAVLVFFSILLTVMCCLLAFVDLFGIYEEPGAGSGNSATTFKPRTKKS